MAFRWPVVIMQDTASQFSEHVNNWRSYLQLLTCGCHLLQTAHPALLTSTLLGELLQDHHGENHLLNCHHGKKASQTHHVRSCRLCNEAECSTRAPSCKHLMKASIKAQRCKLQG